MIRGKGVTLSVQEIFAVSRVLREIAFSSEYPGDDGTVVSNILDATAISSDIPDKPGRHYPVIDIDVPVVLVPSSTPGHSHLYINHEMSWDDFKTLLFALTEAGVVEMGYTNATIDRGRADVRLPWVQKEAECVS